jgi:hypothetical protein
MTSTVLRGLALAVSLLIATKGSAQSAKAALQDLIAGSAGTQAILSGSQTNALVEFIGSSINTFPTVSGSSALVNVKRLGEELPLTQSFGTLLLDRWATTGGTVSFSAYSDVRGWRFLDGFHLASGGLGVRLPDGTGSHSTIDVRSETVGIQSQIGVTKSLDIGLDLPMQRVCVSGRREETVGNQTAIRAADGCSQGIGDVSVRAKYDPLTRQTWGVAVGADVFLPTGNKEALLGRGALQGRLYVTLAKQIKAFELSGEAGTIVGGRGTRFTSTTLFGVQLLRITSVDPSNEIQVGVSISWVPPNYQRLTIFGESLTRSISNLASYEQFGSPDNQSIESHAVDRATQQIVAAGAKFLVGTRWIMGVAATATPTHVGLTPGIGVLAQLERHFERTSKP